MTSDRKASRFISSRIPGRSTVGKPMTDTTRRCWSPSIGPGRRSVRNQRAARRGWNGTFGHADAVRRVEMVECR